MTPALARFAAAADLVRAADLINQLRKCELATGQTFVLEGDRERVKGATRAWRKVQG